VRENWSRKEHDVGGKYSQFGGDADSRFQKKQLSSCAGLPRFSVKVLPGGGNSKRKGGGLRAGLYGEQHATTGFSPGDGRKKKVTKLLKEGGVHTKEFLGPVCRE